MSDPEKAAELQKTVNISPVQSCNSENAYWSGTSLPTQVITHEKAIDTHTFFITYITIASNIIFNSLGNFG